MFSKTLESAGTLADGKTIPFQFSDLDKSQESYYGSNLRVRYLLRLTIEKNFTSNIEKEIEIFIMKPVSEPLFDFCLKVECGYEEAVQVELEIDHFKYRTKDAVLGRVYFHIIRVRLQEITLQVVRREIVGLGKNAVVYEEVLKSFEILDGPVAKGDAVPFRVFLKSCGVSPSYNNISNRASVRYYLKFVFKDEEERTFSKLQEVIIWRPEKDLEYEGIRNNKSV